MSAEKSSEAAVTASPGHDTTTSDVQDSTNYTEEPAGAGVLPSGWMYRQRHIGKLAIPWYASPKIQLGMVAFVCFLCPGMFNALGDMGGGGKAGGDATLADNMVRIHRACMPNLILTPCKRILPCTVPLPFLVSLAEPLSTDWVSRRL
jgi:hypothetical protein